GGVLKETIQVNEESLWAGCKTESDADAREYLPEIQRLLLEGKTGEAVEMANQRLQSNPMRIRSYQPFGNLYAEFVSQGSVSNYRRALDLENGIASVEYDANNVSYRREVFVSAIDNVMVIHFTASKPGSLTFSLRYDREKDASARTLNQQRVAVEGQIFDMPAQENSEPGLHMRFAGIIQGSHKGGEMVCSSGMFYVVGADEATFYVTVATDYDFSRLDVNRNINPLQQSESILNALGTPSYEEMRSKHTAEHAAMMNRVSFDMGTIPDLPTDKRLGNVKKGESDLSLITLYFQYGRYLLMNSSRQPGIMPANLQGIWNQDLNAAWNSDYHTNINIQMNYWPAEVCNLSETMLPFSHFINAVRVPGRETASKTYNSKGWTMNHLSDPFGRTAISDGVGWGTFPMAGPWLVLHQWEHYRFTGDRDYLASEAYPCMKESAEFILSFLVKDKNGYLVTAPSNSPENAYRTPDGKRFNLTYGATMDIEIIREVLDACLQAQKVLGVDAAFGKQLRATLTQLPPIRISKRYNTIQEWIDDYEETEPGHRHVSHLFGLYPGTTISTNTPDLFEAARRTIERRRYYNEVEHQGTYTGWSRAWMINFYARLMDGEEAGKNVELLLARSTQDNLFNTHPPFQIDGNFGGTAGIAEMLLQSHDGVLRLLPALPKAWDKGHVKGLCARGGITVDMVWTDGSITNARLLSKSTQKVKVSVNGKVTTLKLRAGVPFELKP
ncbi:MAG: glycosyl hydrolase family 95 catalytic domain-containing protein, partial [Muribaculaceae bacterium]